MTNERSHESNCPAYDTKGREIEEAPCVCGVRVEPNIYDRLRRAERNAEDSRRMLEEERAEVRRLKGLLPATTLDEFAKRVDALHCVASPPPIDCNLRAYERFVEWCVERLAGQMFPRSGFSGALAARISELRRELSGGLAGRDPLSSQEPDRD